jgi:hypothetical protein
MGITSPDEPRGQNERGNGTREDGELLPSGIHNLTPESDGQGQGANRIVARCLPVLSSLLQPFMS